MLSRIYLLSLLALLVQSLHAEPYKLGFSGPLSGAGAGWGNDVKNVLTFANEKLAAGRYSFIFEDDRCDPKTSVSVAEKLSKVDRVKEVFVVCGQAVLNSAAVYRRAGVTVLAPLATPSRVSTLGVFRTGLSDALAAQKLANQIRRQNESVTVLTEENDYPVGFASDFIRSANECGLSVTNEEFPAGQLDFRTQLIRLKARNARALFLNTQTEQVLSALVRQLRELAMSPKLYGAYLPGSAMFLESSGSLAEGITFVDFPGASDLLNKEGAELYSEYVARFGPLQGWSFAFPATFEAFRSLHLALSSGGSAEKFLHRTSFNGIFGAYSFDRNGDLVGPEHVMRTIRHGRSVPIE